MENRNVEYIKSHVESDLELNRKMNDRDYSGELGAILKKYLINMDNEDALVFGGIMEVGKLEEKLSAETGKMVSFHEIKKCGLAIKDMLKEADISGITEIHKYANELLAKATE